MDSAVLTVLTVQYFVKLPITCLVDSRDVFTPAIYHGTPCIYPWLAAIPAGGTRLRTRVYDFQRLYRVAAVGVCNNNVVPHADLVDGNRVFFFLILYERFRELVSRIEGCSGGACVTVTI